MLLSIKGCVENLVTTIVWENKSVFICKLHPCGIVLFLIDIALLLFISYRISRV